MIQINTRQGIVIDDTATRLAVIQERDGTLVYDRYTGQTVVMPHDRYNLTSDRTVQGIAGISQFEADIRALSVAA